MKITRTYTHRTFGEIGTVTLEGTAELKLDGKVMEREATEYLLTFALQTFQDAYAGAKSADEATANFQKKVERVINNEMGVRSAGGGLSPVDVAIAKLMIGHAAFDLKFAKGTKTADKYAKAMEVFAEAEADTQNSLTQVATRQVKAADAARKAEQELAAGLDISI